MECGTSQLLLVTFVLVSFGELTVAWTRAVMAHFQVCDVISSDVTIQSSTDQGVLDHEDNNLNLIIVTPPKLRPG